MKVETGRLILRQPRPEDWDAYRAYRRSPRSSLGRAVADGEAWTHFAAFFGHWQLRGFGRFVAQRRDTGAPIGHFGPFFPEGHPEREITWTLWDGALEGQGYATEAARAVVDFALGTLGWTSAVSYIERTNARSQALAARLGAVRDPLAPAPYDGTDVWRHGRGRRA